MIFKNLMNPWDQNIKKAFLYDSGQAPLRLTLAPRLPLNFLLRI